MSTRSELVDAYKTDGVHKEYTIVIGNRDTYGNESIVDDSLELKQSIFDGTDLDICGCIASSLTFKLYHDRAYGKNRKVELWVQAGDTDRIKLFTGYIDSCEVEANRSFQTITAYDVLYKLSGNSGTSDGLSDTYNVSSWFNNHSETTINTLLNQLLNKYQVTKASDLPTLVNGSKNTLCGSKTKVSGISALDLLKDICRINACFGYIDGDGKFAWKYLETSPYDTEGYLYPSDYLFPDNTLYPGKDTGHEGENDPTYLGTYRELKYQSYRVLNIDMVMISDYENDQNRGAAGESGNNYYIYGNLCMLNQSTESKAAAARAILRKIKGVFYQPFQSSGIGLPYILPGDSVTFHNLTDREYYRFFIFSRTLKCNQTMTDSYRADGDHYKHEFKVGSSIDTGGGVSPEVEEHFNKVEEDILNVNQNIDNILEHDQQTDTALDNLSTDYDNYKQTTNAAIDEIRHQGLQANIQIVSMVPANPNKSTLYLIKGDTMIL